MCYLNEEYDLFLLYSFLDRYCSFKFFGLKKKFFFYLLVCKILILMREGGLGYFLKIMF